MMAKIQKLVFKLTPVIDAIKLALCLLFFSGLFMLGIIMGNLVGLAIVFSLVAIGIFLILRKATVVSQSPTLRIQICHECDSCDEVIEAYNELAQRYEALTKLRVVK
jgi:hypothetical protein